MDPDLVWGGLLGSALVYEMYAVFNGKQGDTLSERLRVWMRTNTKPGKALFVLGWLGLTAWFVPHILNGG
jgi:hypothetical protein